MNHPDRQPPRPSRDDLDRAAWFKSTRSNGSSTCVEVAQLGPWTAVRDSKDPSGPAHCYTRRQWAQLLSGIRAGQFDLA
jgi:hypothetical protein